MQLQALYCFTHQLKILFMKQIFVAIIAVIIVLVGYLQLSGSSTKAAKQMQQIGGACEGCEAIFETPVPFLKLPSVDTMPDYFEPGPKLEVSGTVFKIDGKTPATDVVVYTYHTDQTGRYPKKGNETGWGKRHGYIRGWIKTKQDGTYKFLTNRPAAYPGGTDPAHIHFTIKEPDKNEYYIEDVLFDDDPLVTNEMRNKQHRGGIGLVTLKKSNGVYYGRRNIYLGKNIPGYPVNE
jgi:protocatechuate 3,4-dioxygenase, beta subunit